MITIVKVKKSPMLKRLEEGKLTEEDRQQLLAGISEQRTIPLWWNILACTGGAIIPFIIIIVVNLLGQ